MGVADHFHEKVVALRPVSGSSPMEENVGTGVAGHTWNRDPYEGRKPGLCLPRERRVVHTRTRPLPL